MLSFSGLIAEKILEASQVHFRRAIQLVAVMCVALGSLAPRLCPAQTPSRELQVMLIRNALTAVSHGNLTGNYTVLRDLGTPAFRERNTAAQLAGIFQRLREQKTDLSPVLALEPQLTEAPIIDQSGELQLVGYFSTQPLQIQFRLAFQLVQGIWVIDTISLGTSEPVPKTPGISGNPPPPNRGASSVQTAPYGSNAR